MGGEEGAEDLADRGAHAEGGEPGRGNDVAGWVVVGATVGGLAGVWG